MKREIINFDYEMRLVSLREPHKGVMSAEGATIGDRREGRSKESCEYITRDARLNGDIR